MLVHRPQCSVVVVAFNSGNALIDCVDSVLGSSVPVEVLVSDNGSTDSSIRVLRERFGGDPRLRIVSQGANLGFAAAANAVVPMTTGAWLLFLNPDCVVQPSTLQRMIEVMEHEPRAGLAGCLLRNTDGTEQAGCRRREPTPWRSLSRVLHLHRLRPGDARMADFNLLGEPLPDQPVPVDAISGAFMLARRKALARVGLLDPGYFLHCEDLDLCRRFRDCGYQVLFVPQVEVLHHKGLSSRGRQVRVEWHKHRGMLRYYRKFFRSEYPAPMMWLVWVAVWGRFAFLTGHLTIRRMRG